MILENLHLAITQIGHLLSLQAKPQCNNEIGDLIVLVQCSIILSLHIQNLSAQWQHCLQPAIPRLLGTATCTSTHMCVKTVHDTAGSVRLTYLSWS